MYICTDPMVTDETVVKKMRGLEDRRNDRLGNDW